METKKILLRKLLEKEQIVAPCVFDNISVRTAELVGFKAVFLSSEDLACSMCGFPDKQLLNFEELVWMAVRMTDYTPLPVIADLGAGFGGTPLHVFNAAARMAKAGVQAVIVRDADGVGGIVSREDFFMRIKAALEALRGTDCMVIAGSDAVLAKGSGLEEAIERCAAARALGAELTLAAGIKTLAQGRLFAERDPGRKVWPGLGASEEVLDASYQELESLGFGLIEMDYALKGAMFGMLDFGKRSLADGNTVYHDTHDFDGMLEKGQDYHVFFSFWKKWLPMERSFNDLSEVEGKTYDIRFDL